MQPENMKSRNYEITGCGNYGNTKILANKLQ